MPNCSVIGCDLKKSQNEPTLTMHRLPRCEDKKKKWLEAIGTDNIRLSVKDIFICSRHFDENAFNRTLAVVRLRDDALPSGPLLRRVNRDDSSFFTENMGDPTSLLIAHNASSLIPVKTEEPAFDATEFPIQNKKIRKIKQLEHICDDQRKKIKRLNQVVRRQKKKIADFRNIIKDLLESNLLNSESSIVLEDCEEKKDLPKGQILESKDFEKQFNEEI